MCMLTALRSTALLTMLSPNGPSNIFGNRLSISMRMLSRSPSLTLGTLGRLSSNGLQGMRESRQYGSKTFLYCLGAARQIDNQGSPTDPSYSPAQHGQRSVLETLCPHRLAKARNNPINYVKSSFRGHISRCQPSASCGKYQIHALVS